MRAEPGRLKAGHAGLHAGLLGEAVGGNHDAVTAPPAADPNRPALQLAVQRDLATGEKTVAIDMQNAVRLGHARGSRYLPAKRRQETKLGIVEWPCGPQWLSHAADGERSLREKLLHPVMGLGLLQVGPAANFQPSVELLQAATPACSAIA